MRRAWKHAERLSRQHKRVLRRKFDKIKNGQSFWESLNLGALALFLRKKSYMQTRAESSNGRPTGVTPVHWLPSRRVNITWLNWYKHSVSKSFLCCHEEKVGTTRYDSQGLDPSVSSVYFVEGADISVGIKDYPCRIRHYVESMQMLCHKAMQNLC